MKIIPVGIDLGTTYSATARINESGKSVIVPNDEGALITPSVVLFEDKNVIVGREAKKVSVVSPDRVAICAKRDMGKPVYSRPIKGQYIPPEVIQSYILRKLKQDVEQRVEGEFQVIITVPAYFDEPRRKATYQAGEMAGLKVLDILNEPTAAALVFGEEQGYLTRFGAPKERMNVIVYDLGGGTFDVTLIDMKPGDLRTLCTDGDVQLGGFDWDMRLVDYMAEEFVRQHGSDPRKSPESLQRMVVAAEEAKHTLSARGKAAVTVAHDRKSLQVEITREKFEEMTADLLERTRYTTRQLLATSGLEWKDINRILLTGGSTRMPMVQQMLKELTGIEPDHSVSPDEAVARGAAIYANYVLASRKESGHKPTFDVTNVNAHSLGIHGIDPQTGRKRNRILIRRNTPLPARQMMECVLKEAGQSSVVVQVLEGESLEPDECSAIGRTVIRDLPARLPKGWPIEITYEYGVNGRLNVTAKVRGTDKETSLELEREDSMSSDKLSKWKNVVADQNVGLDAFEMAVVEDLRKSPAAGAESTGTATGAATGSMNVPRKITPATLSPSAKIPEPTRITPNSGQVVVPQPTGGAQSGYHVAGGAPQPHAPVAPPAPRPVPQPGQGSQPAQQPGAAPAAPANQPPGVAFTCPHCRGTFRVPPAFAGRKISCPKCQGGLIVPAAN